MNDEQRGRDAAGAVDRRDGFEELRFRPERIAIFAHARHAAPGRHVLEEGAPASDADRLAYQARRFLSRAPLQPA